MSASEGASDTVETNFHDDKLATIVSLHFTSNSELLNAFYAAVESNIIL